MRLIISALIFISIFGSSSFAADVPLTIPAGIEPSKVVGIVLSKRGVIEKTGVTVQPQENGSTHLTIPVSRSESESDTLVTAMFETASGEVMFAPLTSLEEEARLKKKDSRKICITPMPIAHDETLVSNIGALQSLLEIRKVRRDFVQLEIANKLRGDLLRKLQNLEAGFGLVNGTPLSPDLPPAELTIRLYRILTAIRNFEANK